MSSKQRQILPRVIQDVCDKHPNCGVLLWGSVQDEREREGSDLDLFVVIEKEGGQITLDQARRFDGVPLDIAWMPVNALRRQLNDEPYLFYGFSQARILRDPKGIAKQHQDVAQAYFRSHQHVADAWEAQAAEVRKHKLNRDHQLAFPAWGDFADHVRQIAQQP